MPTSRRLVEDVKLELLAVHSGMIPRPSKMQLSGKATAGNGSKGGGPAAPRGAAGSYAWCPIIDRLKHQRQCCGGVLAHPRTVREGITCWTVHVESCTVRTHMLASGENYSGHQAVEPLMPSRLIQVNPSSSEVSQEH